MQLAHSLRGQNMSAFQHTCSTAHNALARDVHMQAFLDTMKRRGVSFLEMLAMEMKVLQLVLSHAHCQLFQTRMVAMSPRFALEFQH